MNLLVSGTGNQKVNRKKAVRYIVDNIIDTDTFDMDNGNITSKDGTAYHVSAYAESSAAFISTPGVDKSKYSIYESGLRTLMFRQCKNGEKAIIYEVDPNNISVKCNSNLAEWQNIDKASTRIWVCVDERVKLFDRREDNSD